MPFDGSGTFTPSASSWNPAVSGTEISHTDWNTLRDEIAAGLTKAICKDGQSTTSAVITFAVGVKINNTGLQVFDTDASHYLSIVPGSNLTAARTFTLTTGDAARTLDMSAGNLTAGGGQYVFPASQNASSDANTLDDYEEGTFTPTFTATGVTGVTYGLQSGYYEKIGRLVTILGRVTLTSKGSGGTGNIISLPGLPFTVGDRSSPTALIYDSINLTAGWSSAGGSLTVSTTSVGIVELGDNVAGQSVIWDNIANTTDFQVAGHYHV